MNSVKIHRINAPSFGLSWISGGKIGEGYVLVAGGGGSTKSGVKNQIQLINGDGSRPFSISESFETDNNGESRLCSNILCEWMHVIFLLYI